MSLPWRMQTPRPPLPPVVPTAARPSALLGLLVRQDADADRAKFHRGRVVALEAERAARQAALVLGLGVVDDGLAVSMTIVSLPLRLSLAATICQNDCRRARKASVTGA